MSATQAIGPPGGLWVGGRMGFGAGSLSRVPGSGSPLLDEIAGRGLVLADVRRLEHPDVLVIRLLGNRTTFVHRSVWPDLVAVATARTPWQTEWLPATERALLERVDTDGRVVVDESLAAELGAHHADLGREVAYRLLVLGTPGPEKGPHQRVLRSWSDWLREHAEVRPAADPEAARERLEALARLHGPRASLPWQRVGRRQRFAR